MFRRRAASIHRADRVPQAFHRTVRTILLTVRPVAALAADRELLVEQPTRLGSVARGRKGAPAAFKALASVLRICGAGNGSDASWVRRGWRSFWLRSTCVGFHAGAQTMVVSLW